MAIPETLGDRLRAAMEARGVTQGEVAEALDISRNTINRYVNDDRVPDEATLKRIGAFLQVSPAQLRYPPPGNGTAESRAPSVKEPTYLQQSSASLALYSPQLRAWLHRFEAELAEAGATDDEVQAVRAALTNPGVGQYFARGEKHQFSDEEVRELWEAMANVFRWRLSQLGRRFKTPIRPPIPPPEGRR